MPSFFDNAVNFTQIPASLFFIFSIAQLSNQKTARRGTFMGMVGCAFAIAATIYQHKEGGWSITASIGIGSMIGILGAKKVPMTGLPQMVGLLNSFGGLAAAVESVAFYIDPRDTTVPSTEDIYLRNIAGWLSILVGMITFVGSIVACLKLMGKISGSPLKLKGRHWYELGLLIVCVILGGVFLAMDETKDDEKNIGLAVLLATGVLAGIFGLIAVMGIGGADMPVVISILNSGSGWSTAAAGFMLRYNLLVISGSLVGSSGAILSHIMCVAMNRTIIAVLMGGFGTDDAAAATSDVPKPDHDLEHVEIKVPETVALLKKAKSVIIIPGYGMAVAQAQHAVAELTQNLRARGTTVRFAIHPVAGRLPGHMNVLLAEASVPYNIVLGMDEINDDFPKTDMAIVIGANDIVNPAAEEDPTSDIAGMPVLQSWLAKDCIVMKRSLRPGFSGVANPLFYKPATSMLFGDAKKIVLDLQAELGTAEAVEGGVKEKDVVIEMETKPKNEHLDVPKFKTVGVIREVMEEERKITVTPQTAITLMKYGFNVVIETGLGDRADFPDNTFEAVGVKVLPNAEAVFDEADLIFKTRIPTEEDVEKMKKGQTFVAPFPMGMNNEDILEKLRAKEVNVLDLFSVPRITRAQKLDVLSSMANISGYRGIIEAANLFGSFFTGQVTAAGNVPPCKVMVIGAGVAGLASIGAARALGAIVRAFDTRPVVKEQVQSMGAEFLEVDMEEDGDGAGGYAKVMSKEFIEAEMRLFKEQCKEVNIVVTTANIPGRRAPLLITKEMVEVMAPGSVVVDLASENGGNCELTDPGKLVVHKGVYVVGYKDLPSRMSSVASQLLGSNLCHLMDDMGRGEKFHIDLEDEVVRGITFVHKGERLEPPPKREIQPKKKEVVVDVEKDEEKPEPVVRGPVGTWIHAHAADFMLPFIALVILYMVGGASPVDFHQMLVIFFLAVLAGWKIIWNVAPALHTPLMSETNAISGIVVLGGILQSVDSISTTSVLGFFATLIAMINIAGGFGVTLRMLMMFRSD